MLDVLASAFGLTSGSREFMLSATLLPARIDLSFLEAAKASMEVSASDCAVPGLHNLYENWKVFFNMYTFYYWNENQKFLIMETYLKKCE